MQYDQVLLLNWVVGYFLNLNMVKGKGINFLGSWWVRVTYLWVRCRFVCPRESIIYSGNSPLSLLWNQSKTVNSNFQYNMILVHVKTQKFKWPLPAVLKYQLFIWGTKGLVGQQLIKRYLTVFGALVKGVCPLLMY